MILGRFLLVRQETGDRRDNGVLAEWQCPPKSYLCNRFIPSSGFCVNPAQLESDVKLNFAKNSLIIPLIMVAALLTRSVCLIIEYGASR